MLFVLIALGFALFFFAYIFFIFYQIGADNPIYLNTRFNITYAVVWFFILFGTLKKLKDSNHNNLHNYILIFSLLGLFLSNIYLYNKETAIETLNGNPENSITIYTNTETVMTDSNLVFVGKTDNFLFLRNIKEEENEIYIMDDVIKFSIRKIK